VYDIAEEARVSAGVDRDTSVSAVATIEAWWAEVERTSSMTLETGTRPVVGGPRYLDQRLSLPAEYQ